MLSPGDNMSFDDLCRLLLQKMRSSRNIAGNLLAARGRVVSVYTVVNIEGAMMIYTRESVKFQVSEEFSPWRNEYFLLLRNGELWKVRLLRAIDRRVKFDQTPIELVELVHKYE